MKTKKLIKFFLFITVICGGFILSRNNSHQVMKNSSSKALNNDTKVGTLATHFRLPTYMKGRKLPFHRVYESRQVGFTEDLHKAKNVNETKIILVWTPWNGIKKTINYYFLQPGNESFIKYNCPNPKCIATRNRKYLEKADAIFFHLIDAKYSDLPSYRTSQQVWILYNMEPPWLIKKQVSPELLHLRKKFNWTMSYRSNSDVLSRYGFIKPSGDIANSFPFPNKTKNVVWFVSDCVTDSKREDYVNELKKFIDIDIYGTCGDHKCYPSQSSSCYESVLDKYKFYLSFENAICKNYVTEKFFNIFNYDIIPVIFGGANYSSIAPIGTFIDATKYSEPKVLATILLDISNNEEMYKEFLRKKRLFRSYLDPWMCRLCDALHTKLELTVSDDLEQWWIKDAQCKTWNKTQKAFTNIQ